MLADDLREAVARRIFLAQQQIFPQQFLLVRRALEKQLEVIEVHGLLDEIEGALFHRRDSFFHRAVGGDENHGKGGLGSPRFAQHVEAGTAGKFQVRKNEQVAAAANFLDCGISVRRLVDRVAGALERFAEHGAEFGFVFDKEDRFHDGLTGGYRAQPESPPDLRSSSSASEIA